MGEFSPWEHFNFPDLSEKPLLTGNFFEINQNPCMDCNFSPCCWIVTLQELTPTKWIDFDYMRYLLGFKNIDIVVSNTARWSVLLRNKCRYLDPQKFTCQVHGTDTQPKICVGYSAYNCWYKRFYSADAGGDHIRFNLTRFNHMLKLIKFDEHGNLVYVPPFEDLKREIDAIKVEDPTPVAKEKKNNSTKMSSQSSSLLKNKKKNFFSLLKNPCEGCRAPCCRQISFPFSMPNHWIRFDYMRYLIGFPMISFALTGDSWKLIVNTTCRFFDEETGKCTIYGTKERPVYCSTFNQWECDLEHTFYSEKNPNFINFNYEQFEKLLEIIEFNDDKTVSKFPSVETILNNIF